MIVINVSNNIIIIIITECTAYAVRSLSSELVYLCWCRAYDSHEKLQPRQKTNEYILFMAWMTFSSILHGKMTDVVQWMKHVTKNHKHFFSTSYVRSITDQKETEKK